MQRNGLGINIFESKYAKTKLAEACKEVLETGKPRFSDLETGFDPVGIEASGYLVQMMIDEEDVKDPNTGQLKRDPDTGEIIKVPVRVGIMAIRIPVEQINEIMMKKIFNLCNKYNVKMQASLERYMKCGVGICDSCAINSFHVCKDGPVFDEKKLVLINEFGYWKRSPSGKKIPV